MGHLSAMLSERNGDIKIVKIDVDESRELAQRYNVKGIPTLILFQNGVPADARLNGFSDKRRLHNYVDDVFNGQV
jgi:thioredoxin 1